MRLAAALLVLSSGVAAADATIDVYLVGRSGAMARMLEQRLGADVNVRVAPEPPSARAGFAVVIERRVAVIRDLASGRSLREIPLRRGLNAAGRAAIAQALRTVVASAR
ncbi:MAG: hypothetical protein AAGE52_35520 [Myxococcota bacterium]